ncbi:hypothetical protein VMCG_06431 [Cytospora schulzeri]|uniref:Palmitoyl-protein thioesterase 1 n=1 Tax=Cytospora schulzeri TaxID=448051 RepID=A0A423W7W7_9PEZI|nr:hypothetical protein VMCG_06431 [Valsa malicola]
MLTTQLLTIGSLIASTVVALPSLQQPLRNSENNDDDDNDDTPLPLIIWHGLGDSYGNKGLQEVAALAEAANPGTLVYMVKQGSDASGDSRATFFGNVNEQVDKLCADLATDQIISTAPAIDALGFSQGGQFLRAYVERCNVPPVRSLVTFGSQHNGILDFSDCSPTNFLCRGAMALLRGNVWSSYVQNNLVPAQYYRPTAESEYEAYLENSNFIADINNERADKSPLYKRNLAGLENFVMFMFEDDKTVIPKETAWFSEVNGTEVTPLRARSIYEQDWIGLRELDRKGGLKFRVAPGEHMQLEVGLLNDTFSEFYGPYKKTFSHEPKFEDEL